MTTKPQWKHALSNLELLTLESKRMKKKHIGGSGKKIVPIVMSPVKSQPLIWQERKKKRKKKGRSKG
jgi:hypothetical protein